MKNAALFALALPLLFSFAAAGCATEATEAESTYLVYTMELDSPQYLGTKVLWNTKFVTKDSPEGEEESPSGEEESPEGEFSDTNFNHLLKDLGIKKGIIIAPNATADPAIAGDTPDEILAKLVAVGFTLDGEYTRADAEKKMDKLLVRMLFNDVDKADDAGTPDDPEDDDTTSIHWVAYETNVVPSASAGGGTPVPTAFIVVKL